MAKILHRGHSDDGLMRGEGKFEIIQLSGALKLQLYNIEKAGRICYRSQRHEITQDSANKFIRMIMRRGHESVIEHSCLTVIFSDISRGFTHEMCRHRLASYSQESTRYVDYAGGKLDLDEAELTFVVPPHQDLGALSHGVTAEHMIQAYENFYKHLRNLSKWKECAQEVGFDWPPQDARQFLPIGIASKIAVTANFREWRHIFAMRTQKAAHWEIRYIMVDLLTRLKEIIPVIFEDFYREPVWQECLFEKVAVAGEFQTDKDGYGYYVKGDWSRQKGTE